MDADASTVTNELDSWNRPRTTEELRDFVNFHHSLLPDTIEIE